MSILLVTFLLDFGVLRGWGWDLPLVFLETVGSGVSVAHDAIVISQT